MKFCKDCNHLLIVKNKSFPFWSCKARNFGYNKVTGEPRYYSAEYERDNGKCGEKALNFQPKSGD